MWRRWIAILSVLALVIAMIAIAEIFSLATEGQPHGAYRTHNQYQPVYAALVQLLLGGWNWLRDRADRDTLTSVFIGVTAIFTGTLWWTTRQLWQSSQAHTNHLAASVKATEESAKAAMTQARIAERSFYDLERPYMFLLEPKATLENARTVAPDGRIMDVPVVFDVKYTLHNHGRTPAILTEVQFIIEFIDALPIPPNYKGSRGQQPMLGEVIIGSNLPSEEYASSAYSFSAHDHQRIMSDIEDRELYFFGYVRYRDVFGNRYIRGHAMTYIRNYRAFHVRGGDSYNYDHKDEGASEPLA